jgi:hypothetical protein
MMNDVDVFFTVGLLVGAFLCCLLGTYIDDKLNQRLKPSKGEKNERKKESL